jgi:HlyD family secretion protein
VKKKLPILLVVLLAGAGAWYFLGERGRDPGDGLELHGNVDIRDAHLGFRVSGRLVELTVDEGDAVETGQILARLDAEPYERTVQDAEARVEAARARLALLEAGFRIEEIEQGRAQVEAAKVRLANAERRLKRETEMKGTGASPVMVYEDALDLRNNAAAELRVAKASLDLLEAGFRVEEVAQARAELAAGEASLARARLQVEDTVLLAPSDGIILTRAVEPGTILNPGTTVYSLSLVRPVWIRAYVGEPDLGLLRPGQTVEVYSDTFPDQPYAGQVGFISPTAEFTPKTVETRELRTGLVYRFRVVVEDPDDGLRQGMPVRIWIEEEDLNRRD